MDTNTTSPSSPTIDLTTDSNSGTPDTSAAPPRPPATDQSTEWHDQYQRNLQQLPALIQSLSPPSTPDTHTMPPERPSEPAPSMTPQPMPATASPPTNNQPQPPQLDTDHSWRTRPYPVNIPTSSASPRWQQLIQDPTELEIQSFSCGWDADFHAGTLNIGGSLRDRIKPNGKDSPSPTQSGLSCHQAPSSSKLQSANSAPRTPVRLEDR